MDLILAINCGSSSIKACLYQHKNSTLTSILEAHISNNTLQIANQVIALKKERSHPQKILRLLEELQKHHSLKNLTCIGHRFVHGGALFASPVTITSKVRKQLESLTSLAPLHNQSSLQGVAACNDYFGKKIPQIAVFDTAFHQHMPEVSALYAIPYSLTKKYGIRRYGFHGISHAFLWDVYKKHTAKAKAKVITLHLGAGSSACAIKDGISIDTSMGFTPAEGLVMATRAGDIDAALIPFLCKKEKLSAQAVLDTLNLESGLLGLSSHSAEMHKLLSKYNQDKQARLAIDLFCYRVIKYIGAYIAVLGGLDALIFSGGIGEHAPKIRSLICKGLKWYNLSLDTSLNRRTTTLSKGSIQKISKAESKVRVYVIATDENRSIANHVLQSRCL